MYSLVFFLALAGLARSQNAECIAWLSNQDQINCFSNLGINYGSGFGSYSSFNPDSVSPDQAWGFCQCISSAPTSCGDIFTGINTFCASGEDCVKSIVNAAPAFVQCVDKYSSDATDSHVLAKCACFSEANLNCDESLTFLGVQAYCKAVYDTVDAVVDALGTKIVAALNALSSTIVVTIQAVPNNGGHDRQIIIVDSNSEGLVKIEAWVTDTCGQINNWISSDCDGHDACKNIHITCPVVQSSKRSDTYTTTLGYTGSSGVTVVSVLGLLSLLVLALL